MSEWSFEPVWNNRWLAIIMIGLLMAIILGGPRFGTLSSYRKNILFLLRLLSLLLVFCLILRPSHVFTSTKPRSSIFLVLFDMTRSMQLPEGASGTTRWEAQKEALTSLRTALPQLVKQTETLVYGYDTQLKSFDTTKWDLANSPSGNLTDIGTTLEEALRRETGKRLAGVLLMGDATQTATESAVESQSVARRLREEFGAPLYTTVFGPAGDATQAKDIAIERLDEQYTVFVKNEMNIRGRLKIAGYVNQPIPLEFNLTDATGKQTTIGQLKKTAKQDGESLEFEFPYIPQQAGHYKLTVQAQVQSGELVTKNNALTAFLNVLEGGLRVLFIDSGKRAEFKFLTRTFHESPDIELDEFLIDAAHRQTWPVKIAPVLQATKYDVIILGNVPAMALGNDGLAAIAKEVEAGKGFLALGGIRTFGAGNYFGTPLASLLPVEFNRFEKQDFEGADRNDLFHNGPLALVPVALHATTRLAEGNENAATWKQLPPLDFANKFVGLKNAPGVRVLLQGSQQEPLLISGEYGNGRVLAFAGESTYRWVLKGFAAQHKRFWRQNILWLAQRDESQQSEVWVKLPQRRFQLGATVAFTLGARTPEGDELPQAQFQAVLLDSAGVKQVLRIAPGKAMWSGSHRLTAAGDYAIEVTATLAGRELGKARTEFYVHDQDLELSMTHADHEHFARLANVTKDVGGRVVPAEELPKLFAEIANREPDLEIHQEKWRLCDSALSAWSWLLGLVALLGSEWWLRKKWGLV